VAEAAFEVLRLEPARGRVVSHPDVTGDGVACCYVATPGGGSELWAIRGSQRRAIAVGCGPLGPTAGGAGLIAYRAATPAGEGVHLWDGARSIEIDRAADGVAGFEGLPVVTARGAVVYRATLAGGGHEVRLFEGGRRRTIADTATAFSALGRFPMINAAHEVVFAATTRDSGDALFVWRDGLVERAASAGGGFTSIRGGLLSDAGTLLVIGTAVDGGLGVFTDAAGEHAIVQVGMPLLGSTVTEFALNPVSVNARDQVAVRVSLADGSEAILRADPVDDDGGRRAL
jgi:hypothetical protein